MKEGLTLDQDLLSAGNTCTPQEDHGFQHSFLTDLRKVFQKLHPEIRETATESIHYFALKGWKICLYNSYPGGIQLVFNQNLITRHFADTYECAETMLPDWNLIITIIIDIADKIHRSGTGKPVRWKPVSYRSGSSSS